jgi:hypothetical protein
MTRQGKSVDRISRREFARGGALAAASAACLPGALLQQASAQTPAKEPALSTASQEEVDAKVAAILRQYGQLLTDPEKIDLRRLMTEGQKPIEQMRAFSLENSDQPGNVLKLFPDAARSVAPARKSGAK